MPCDTIDVAVAKALDNAATGEVLLLAPACTSFDQYTDFEARGKHFRALIADRGTPDVAR
jgi:UDP-N-acetylmuramoylalanine--D-glutamate ligase